MAQRKLDEAEEHYEHMSKAGWIAANPLVQRWSSGYQGYIKLLSGNVKEARRTIEDAIAGLIEFYEQSSNVDDGWMFLDAKARLEMSEGHAERAAFSSVRHGRIVGIMMRI